LRLRKEYVRIKQTLQNNKNTPKHRSSIGYSSPQKETNTKKREEVPSGHPPYNLYIIFYPLGPRIKHKRKAASQ